MERGMRRADVWSRSITRLAREGTSADLSTTALISSCIRRRSGLAGTAPRLAESSSTAASSTGERTHLGFRR